MVRFVLLLVLNCIVFSVKSQSTFHKVYTLGDTTVFFNSVLEKDSVYFVTGTIGRGGQRLNSVIVEVEKNGSIHDAFILNDPNYLNVLGNSFSKMDTNIFGEYLLHFTSAPLFGDNLFKHTITKFNSGTNIFTTVYLDTLAQSYFSYLNAPVMFISNSDSTYFTSSSYGYFDAIDTSSSLPDNFGFFVIKFAQINDSIHWIKRFTYNLLNPNGPTFGRSNILKYDNESTLVVSFEMFNGLNDYAKMVFYRLDKNGNIVQTKFLQDTPYSRVMYGSTFLNNKNDLLICYTNSEWITSTLGTSYWGLTPAVARLDSNFNVLWKKDLGGLKFNPSQLEPKHMINKFAIIGDSAFVGGYFSVREISFNDSIITVGHVTLVKGKTLDGDSFWQRDYAFYPQGQGIYKPRYEIRDVEVTNDDGIIFVGEALNQDSLVIGAPSQLGYIIKTNCLGFLGEPEVGFTNHSNDSLGVHFTNTSLQAGSYLWDFGDSTILQTGENMDTIFHQYIVAGNYEVSLIGYGCNGENDTVRYTITVPEYTQEPTDTVIIANLNIVNYIALGPNPVKSGESIAVYVGNLPSAIIILSFYNNEGKLVLENAIPKSKSTYIISLPFSAGVYQAVLRSKDEILEVEKVVVY